MIRPVILDAPRPAGATPVARNAPLSHHEMLRLVAPFARLGWQVDMASSRRADRHIAFVARTYDADTNAPAMRESVSLQVFSGGALRLTRRLVLIADAGGDARDGERAAADGAGPLTAELTIEGDDSDAALAQLNRFGAHRHFERVGGVWLARDYAFPSADERGGAMASPVLVSARARIAGIVFEMDARTDYPLRLQLAASNGERLMIPDDLLAVIGRQWRPLRNFDTHWRGTIRVSRQEPARSAQGETLLRQTVAHLAATLADSPAQFHARFRARRWRVMLRRLQPLAAIGLLVAASVGLGQFPISEGSFMLMVILHAPPLMLIALFAMRELPRFELPAFPRRLGQQGWREAAALVDAHAVPES